MRIGRRITYLAAPLLVAGLAACGGGEQTQSTANAPAADSTAAPAAAAPAAAPAPAPAGSAAAPAAAGTAGGEVAEGQQIFTSTGNCYTCHGPDAKGTALAPNLTDNQWLWFDHPPTVDELVQRIKTGVPQPKQHPAPMPPMGGATLTDAQVHAVATYVHSLSPGG